MSFTGPTTRMRTRSTMQAPQAGDLQPKAAPKAQAVNGHLKQAHLAGEGATSMSRDPSLDRVDKGRKRSGYAPSRHLVSCWAFDTC